MIPASEISIGSPFSAGLGAAVEPSAPPSAEVSAGDGRFFGDGFGLEPFGGSWFSAAFPASDGRGARLAFDGGGGGFQRVGADGKNVGVKMPALDGDGDSDGHQQKHDDDAGEAFGRRNPGADKFACRFARAGFFLVPP